MPRRYSPEEKQQILDRVKANRGNVERTAAEFGIHPATIYKWRKTAKFANSLSSFSSPISPTPIPDSSVGTGLALSANTEDSHPIPPDDLQAFRDLKARMLELTNYIIVDDRIKQAIDAAPLKERIAAATQLIDRMIKLAAELPADREEDEIEEVILMYEGEVIDDEEANYEDFDEETTPESADNFR